MPDQTETRTGRCPTHGTVQATRPVPRPAFPYLVYLVRRISAARRPFRCPTCGSSVEVDPTSRD